jgi:hypothetical protein
LTWRQLTIRSLSLKQIKVKHLKRSKILNLSQNRIFSLDWISVLQPSSRQSASSLAPPSPTQSLSPSANPPLPPQSAPPSPSQSPPPFPTLPQPRSSPSPPQPPVKRPSPLQPLIPVPRLYDQLLYLNISTNYLFSLHGVQCCRQLKVSPLSLPPSCAVTFSRSSQCLIASDNMITSLWPLVHCLSLEYLDMSRNQLAAILCLEDLSFIRTTCAAAYDPPPEARVLLTDERLSRLPSSLTFLDVSYNSQLSSLVGLVSSLSLHCSPHLICR